MSIVTKKTNAASANDFVEMSTYLVTEVILKHKLFNKQKNTRKKKFSSPAPFKSMSTK